MPYSSIEHSPMKVRYADEIVVDRAHRYVVERELNHLGVGTREVADSRLLRLTRLKLRDVLRALADQDHAALLRRVTAAGAGVYDPGRPPTELDLLLFLLRERFAAANGNWTPIMGTIRFLGLEGTPYSGGSEGEPLQAVASTSFELPPKKSVSPGRKRIRVHLLDTAMPPDSRLAGRYTVYDDDAVWQATTKPAPATQFHSQYLLSLMIKNAPHADFTLRRSLDEMARGDLWTLAHHIAESREADVIVVAAAAAVEDGRIPLLLRRACAVAGDAVIVAAAGNHGKRDPAADRQAGKWLSVRNSVMVPAAVEGVYGVGALDGAGNRADYSQDAAWIRAMAPGNDQVGLFPARTVQLVRRDEADDLVPVGTRNFGGQAVLPGTSTAAAMFAAAVAAHAHSAEITAQEAAEELSSTHPWGPTPFPDPQRHVQRGVPLRR